MKAEKTFSLFSRVSAAALCAVMVLSLAACGDKPATSSDDVANTTTSAVSTKKTKKKTTATTQADKTTSATKAPTTQGTTAAPTTKAPATTVKTTAGKWDKTTKAETVLSSYNLKASDYILNTQIHRTRYYGGDSAYPHVKWQGPFVDSSAGFYKRSNDLITYSLEEYGFFVDTIWLNKPLSEWGFNFHNLEPGASTGLGYIVLPEAGFRKEKPKDRKDALRIIKNWADKQYEYELSQDVWESCPGYYLYNHYAGEWGCDSFAAEIGESINHTQASIAFTRGAARTYDKPFNIDISPWYGNVHNGHSPSINERQAMASMMGGAAFVMAEGGEWTLVSDDITGDKHALNGVGKAFRKVINFLEKNPNTGMAYTPFGLVFDYYHGMYPNERFTKKAFGYFNYDNGDMMSWNLLNMFFPTGWESMYDESDYLVNSPYGDTADGLLQNAPQDVLNSYPCLILSGNIAFSSQEVSRYVNYVKQGGTLVMNTVYLNQFADYKSKYSGSSVKEITDGKGKVIVYGPDYDLSALDGIIKDQLAKLVPFTVSTTIEHLISIKDGTMYVTLINNEGYTKTPQEEPKIDNTKKKDVKVTYTGNLAIKGVKEIYANNKVTLSGKSVTITVKPGEIKVLEFKFD